MPAGVATVTVRVTALAVLVAEGSESFSVNLWTNGAALTPSSTVPVGFARVPTFVETETVVPATGALLLTSFTVTSNVWKDPFGTLTIAGLMLQLMILPVNC